MLPHKYDTSTWTFTGKPIDASLRYVSELRKITTTRNSDSLIIALISTGFGAYVQLILDKPASIAKVQLAVDNTEWDGLLDVIQLLASDTKLIFNSSKPVSETTPDREYHNEWISAPKDITKPTNKESFLPANPNFKWINSVSKCGPALDVFEVIVCQLNEYCTRPIRLTVSNNSMPVLADCVLDALRNSKPITGDGTPLTVSMTRMLFDILAVAKKPNKDMVKRRLSPSEQYFGPVHSEHEWVSGVTQMDDGSNEFAVVTARYPIHNGHSVDQHFINSRTSRVVAARVLKAWANTKVLESNELTYALTTLLKANCAPEVIVNGQVQTVDASDGITIKLPDYEIKGVRLNNVTSVGLDNVRSDIPLFQPNTIRVHLKKFVMSDEQLVASFRELIKAEPINLITPKMKEPGSYDSWADSMIAVDPGKVVAADTTGKLDSSLMPAGSNLKYGELVVLKSRQNGLTEAMSKSYALLFPIQYLLEGDYTSLNGTQWHKIQSGDSLESHNNAINNQGVNMSMTSQQLGILQKLAKINKETDEFAHLTNTEDLGDELSKAVSELRDEERAGAIKEAAQLVLTQLNAAKGMIESNRAQLAALRRSEKQTIANIEYTAVAMTYGRETQNFLPLAYHLECGGVIERVPQENRVPEADFKRLLEQVRAKQKATQQAAKPAAKTTAKPAKV